MSGNCLIRMASEADAREILSIYAPYVKQTAVTFEYEVPELEEFTGRIRRTRARYPYLIAVQDGKIAGYAYAGPFHTRAAYSWSAELSIYVDWNKRGEGIGGSLFEKLEEILRRQGILNLYACIAWPNPESIRFHEKRGFSLAGRFRQCGYKLGQWWDMVWMEKQLAEHPNPPAPVKATGEDLR